MSPPISLPPRVRPSKVCDRCGLWYPKKKNQCPHCEGMNDAEVAVLKEQYEDLHQGNSNLGRQFLLIAAVVALLFLGVLAFVL